MISTSITNSISKSVETTEEEKEVVEYGINIALSELTKLSAIILISIPLGIVKYSLFIIVVLGILRSLLGGVHAHTHIGCFLTYSIIIFSIIVISCFCGSQLSKIFMFLSLPFVYTSIYKYAPADIENKPILSTKQRKFLRKAGILAVSLLYVIALFLPKIFSNMIIFTLIIEAVTMLPIIYKITKNKYGYERSN